MKMRIVIFVFILMVDGACFAQTKNFTPLGPFGGHVIDIDAARDNADIMYVVIDDQGSGYKIYKTTDGAENWSFLTLITEDIYSISIDPNDNNIIYASAYSHYIYKSTNGGISWKALTIGTAERVYFYGIQVDDSNSDFIYGFGKIGSIEDQTICFLKSTNGGENWLIHSITSDIKYHIYGKNWWIIDPNDTNNLFILTSYADGLKFHPFLFKSGDGGATWQGIDLSNITSMVNTFCMDVDKNGTIIMCFGDAGIYKSTDSGLSWIRSTAYPKNLYSIKYLSDNPDIIAGGHNDVVYISTDGGIIWIAYTHGLSGGNIERIIFNSSKEFTIGNECGILKSTDAGATWFEKNEGINIKDISALEVSKSNPAVMYVGVPYEGIYKTTNAGTSWILVKKSYQVISLSIDANIIYSLEPEGARKYNVYKTKDSGITWNVIKNTERGFDIVAKDNFVWLSYKPTFGSLFKLAKSTNGGADWSDYLISDSYGSPSSITIDPQNSDIIYVGGYFSKKGDKTGFVFKSTDSGVNWINIFTASGKYRVYSVHFDPSNSNIVYFNADDGIYKSTSGGIGWKKVYTGLSNALYIDTKGKIYGRISDGLIVSTENDTVWEKHIGILPSINSYTKNALHLDENKGIIYTGTAQEGVWAVQLGAITNVNYDRKKTITDYKLFSNYPNPFNQHTVIRFQVSGVRDQGSGGMQVRLEIYNILGQLVTTLVDEEKMPGEYRVFWDGKNMRGEDVPSGVYFYRMQTGDFSKVKKMVLMR